MFEWKASFDPKMLGDVLAMRMGRSVAGTVRAFTPDPRVAQMIDHFTQYVGSSPYGSPAVLCGIAHMQTARRRLVSRSAAPAPCRAALVKLATRARRRVPHRREDRENPVARRRSHAACAPTTARRVALSAVVSNCDSVRTHRELHRAAPPAWPSSAGANTSPHAPASCSTSA